jgi:ferrous iron transport protein A
MQDSDAVSWGNMFAGHRRQKNVPEIELHRRDSGSTPDSLIDSHRSIVWKVAGGCTLMDTTTLSELQAGQKGTIVAIDGGDSVAARLMEMGLIPGESVEMVGQAPLGDPVEYEVVGYRLSLRRVEARRVRIERA